MHTAIWPRRHCDGDCKRRLLPCDVLVNQSEIKLEDLQIVSALVIEVFDECAALMSVVNDFHGLFETNGNEDAKDDDEEMVEEFAACRDAVVRRMDIDHRGGFLHGDFSRLLTHDFGWI